MSASVGLSHFVARKVVEKRMSGRVKRARYIRLMISDRYSFLSHFCSLSFLVLG